MTRRLIGFIIFLKRKVCREAEAKHDGSDAREYCVFEAVYCELSLSERGRGMTFWIMRSLKNFLMN